MKNELIHEGIAVSVASDTTMVEIPVSSACAQCHAKAVCGSDIGDSRIIPIKRKDDGSIKQGDKVMVAINRKMGVRAVLLAYIIPLVILLVLLLTLQRLLGNEVVAGLVSIGVTLAYYGTLAIFRGKIDSGFEFNIKIDR